MPFSQINTESELEKFCAELAQAPVMAFDTEFVTENTYRPELCLIQVATSRGLTVIDPLAVGNVGAFWRTLTTPTLTTVVHAGRTDVEFCLYSTGSLPARLVDVQLASGFVGLEYPSGYSSLVHKLLGQALSKHETRTDWRRRPLSGRQLEYAVDDVRYLCQMWEALESRLVELGRMEWYEDEMTRWTSGIRDALERESWQRVSGNTGLDARALAVLREIWRWRHEEAIRSNKPPRRILRDDLMVELAKRKSADPKRILALRGMEWRVHKRWIPEIVSAVDRALSLSKSDLPRLTPREKGPQAAVLGQFLFAALGSVCRDLKLAPSLVGGPNDIREWIAWRNDTEERVKKPRLAEGWRADIVGSLFDELLSGRVSVRIENPTSDSPLVFDRETK